jgi:ferrous iron transport protein B
MSAATVVLTGNPNSGKTTLFNVLTGMRARVGNYPGVTVERKEGRMLGPSSQAPVDILDLPGSYSLSPQSLDEQVARDLLFQRLPEVPKPDLVVIVVDASNLERSLYYATQIIELGYPTVVALNMVDLAEASGLRIDADPLSRMLGVPVVPTSAPAGLGLDLLRQSIVKGLKQPEYPRVNCFFDPPAVVMEEWERLRNLIPRSASEPAGLAASEAALLLSHEGESPHALPVHWDALRPEVARSRTRLEAAQIPWDRAIIEARHARVSAIFRAVAAQTRAAEAHMTDRWDRILTHKTWGLAIFMVLMAILFQTLFIFAHWPMHLLDTGVAKLGGWVGGRIPPGEFHSLVTDGIIAGVGAVVVFLPQICLLFLFIGLLEETGYMARAALLMNRLMSKVGLHGKSFIPLLSSFACAIPGILAARTIENSKDRLITILVAPLMTCSARLPVYTLLIAACIPHARLWGGIQLQGLVLFSMYVLGIGTALGLGWILKKTLVKGAPSMLILELPPFRAPVLGVLLGQVWQRCLLFLKKAGTVILGINILLWFFASYPKSNSLEQDLSAQQREAAPSSARSSANGAETGAERRGVMAQAAAAERLKNSIAGRAGRLIEPVLIPLGMDWQIGIGLITSFAAREVFVSTMATVYSVGKGGAGDDTAGLARAMQELRRPDGTKLYTPLLGITLMVFYAFALQCISTIVIVRKETGSWKWPMFQWLYLGALAWLGAFVVYQGGRLLGWA